MLSGLWLECNLILVFYTRVVPVMFIPVCSIEVVPVMLMPACSVRVVAVMFVMSVSVCNVSAVCCDGMPVCSVFLELLIVDSIVHLSCVWVCC